MWYLLWDMWCLLSHGLWWCLSYRQWHWSILGGNSQAGDEVLKKPNLPPRGVPNPNGGSRFTARLSDLYGTNNSSGHLWTSAKMISKKSTIFQKVLNFSHTPMIMVFWQNAPFLFWKWFFMSIYYLWFLKLLLCFIIRIF